MQIELQRLAGISYVEQIKVAIAERIRSGLLEEGSRLPSIRQLAKQIAVSVMTVVKAYEELEGDGFVERVHGKGTFVKRRGTMAVQSSHPEQEGRSDAAEERGENRLQWHLAIPDYLPRTQVWTFDQPGMNIAVNLSVATVDPDLLPHAELGKELERILRETPDILVRYGPIQGDGELRAEIAKYQRERGLQVTAEEVLITSGAQQGIDLVARTFVGRGDVVIVEAPTYPSALDVFRGRGATVIPVPVDKDGMRLDLLTALCDQYRPKLIYTIPTFQNPTGTVMSLNRRQQLLALATGYHCLIVEDNPWNEMVFDGVVPPPTLMQLDEDGCVIHLCGFSKTMAPGMRIAGLLARGTVLKRLVGAKANADLGSPLLTQKALLAFLRSKQGKQFPHKLAKAIVKKRDITLAALQKHAPAGMRWTVPSGGLNIWITLPEQLRAEDVLLATRQQGVTFLQGSRCFPGEPEYHHLRLSFSQARDEELLPSIRTLCGAVSTLLHRPREFYGNEPVL